MFCGRKYVLVTMAIFLYNSVKSCSSKGRKKHRMNQVKRCDKSKKSPRVNHLQDSRSFRIGFLWDGGWPGARPQQ